MEITINTGYETIEVSVVSVHPIATLRFRNVNTNESFIVKSSSSFPSRETQELWSWAKARGYAFPSVKQMKIIHRVYNGCLHKWLIENDIHFNFSSSYITNEVLSGVIENPYGEDFVINKFVCYSSMNDTILIKDADDYSHYVLVEK